MPLSVSDGLSAWIKDFMKSDAPQFKGKTKEEIVKMAIAAYTDAGGKLKKEGKMKTFKELRESFLVEGMSKRMPISKYAKLIGITPKDQQWILDNEADMIVFEPNQNKANSFLVLSYPVNTGDYYFAFLTGKSSDPQDKMRDLASKANAKMNKILKQLVKKNAASMGDSNLSGFIWIEMMKEFDKLPRQLGAGDTMTREELATAIEDAVGAPIIWEGTDTSNKPQIAEGILDKIMDKIRRAKKKVKKIKLGRKAKTNMESKEVKEYKDPTKYFPRDREWKQLMRKHKRHIKALQDKGKDLPSNAEEEIIAWAMDAGEIRTSDDIESFIDDYLLNAHTEYEGNSLNELNGQTGPVLRIAYKPQKADGKKLTSHSTIVHSDLYRDVYYNKKNWAITANTNSIEIRLPHPKGDERDRKHFMDLINSAKGDVSNLIRGGGLTRSEVQELKRDYEKAAKAFGATKVVSQDHSIYVEHDVPGKLKVKAGLLAMLKALDEFGMRNHISLNSRNGVLTQIQDAGQYNESVNEKAYTKDEKLVQQAVGIALQMGGNMTGAYKKIEKLKRGLGNHPVVKAALKLANESKEGKTFKEIMGMFKRNKPKTQRTPAQKRADAKKRGKPLKKKKPSISPVTGLMDDIKEGAFSVKLNKPYKRGDEKMYMDIIKKYGGKNLKYSPPKGRDPELDIYFDGGNVKKMKTDLDKMGKGSWISD